MTSKLDDAVYDLAFCGPYLIKYEAIAHWTTEAGTKRFALKELLDFAGRITAAAEIIRQEIEKGSAD